MEVIEDVVGTDPVIVFCGLAGAESTRTRDHYYASPGNSFWECLHLAGLTPRRLRPDEDGTVPAYGLGLTDLVGHWDHDSGRGWVEIEELVAKVERWEPAFVAFTAKATAGWAARALGHRPPGLGPVSWGIGRSEVFVLPGTSGANQRHDYDGRPNRLAWWRDLAALAEPELTARAAGDA
jgi:TDG/mug DNA glycosylase family protein